MRDFPRQEVNSLQSHPGTKFNQLGIQVNEDNSMTLMANFTGKSAEVNSWRILPSITRNSWIEREDDDGEGVLTQPEAVYGQSYIVRTINGEPWNGVMPTAPGEYTVNWTIPATGEYTGLFAELSFKITPYVDPILSSLRVFRKGGTYWMGVNSLQAAAKRAAGGGIIEVNTNYLYCGSNSEFNGDVILRACTDPRVTAREFIVDLHSVNVGVTCGGKGGDQFGVWTDGEAKKGFVCDAKPNLLTRIKNGLLLWSTPGMLISIF